MTTYDDRQKAYEAKFAHDAELKFKAEARRDKLVGLWAGEKFGLSGDALEAYAKEVVIADLEEEGDEDVIRKLLKDFEQRGVPITREDILTQLSQKMVEAVEQIENEA